MHDDMWIISRVDEELLTIYTIDGRPYLFCTDDIDEVREEADRIHEILIACAKNPTFNRGPWVWSIYRDENAAYGEYLGEEICG